MDLSFLHVFRRGCIEVKVREKIAVEGWFALYFHILMNFNIGQC